MQVRNILHVGRGHGVNFFWPAIAENTASKIIAFDTLLKIASFRFFKLIFEKPGYSLQIVQIIQAKKTKSTFTKVNYIKGRKTPYTSI